MRSQDRTRIFLEGVLFVLTFVLVSLGVFYIPLGLGVILLAFLPAIPVIYVVRAGLAQAFGYSLFSIGLSGMLGGVGMMLMAILFNSVGLCLGRGFRKQFDDLLQMDKYKANLSAEEAKLFGRLKKNILRKISRMLNDADYDGNQEYESDDISEDQQEDEPKEIHAEAPDATADASSDAFPVDQKKNRVEGLPKDLQDLQDDTAMDGGEDQQEDELDDVLSGLKDGVVKEILESLQEDTTNGLTKGFFSGAREDQRTKQSSSILASLHKHNELLGVIAGLERIALPKLLYAHRMMSISTFLQGFCGALLGILLLVLLTPVFTDLSLSAQFDVTLAESLNAVQELQSEAFDAAQLEEITINLQYVREMLQSSFPMLLFLIALLITFTGFMISRWLLPRFTKEWLVPLPPFSIWYLPRATAYLICITMLPFFFFADTSKHWFLDTLASVNQILFLFCIIQGIAVLDFYLSYLNCPKWICLLLRPIFFVIPLLQQLMLLVGLVDVGVDLRKVRRRSIRPSNGQSTK